MTRLHSTLALTAVVLALCACGGADLEGDQLAGKAAGANHCYFVNPECLQQCQAASESVRAACRAECTRQQGCFCELTVEQLCSATRDYATCMASYDCQAGGPHHEVTE